MTIDELNRRTEDKELTWEVKLSEATGLYITRCPELGLISQGRTEQEALDSIQDSTRL